MRANTVFPPILSRIIVCLYVDQYVIFLGRNQPAFIVPTEKPGKTYRLTELGEKLSGQREKPLSTRKSSRKIS
jgi:hypothetical protein